MLSPFLGEWIRSWVKLIEIGILGIYIKRGQIYWVMRVGVRELCPL
jgi:hypothetical protein